MGLYKFKPTPSGRMGGVCTLSTIRESVLIEIGVVEGIFYSNIEFPKIENDKYSKIQMSNRDDNNLYLSKKMNLDSILDNIYNKYKPKAIFLINMSDIYIDRTKLIASYPNTKILNICYANDNIEYSESIEKTLLLLVREFATNCNKTKKVTFNIIGSCCDMYNYDLDIKEIIRILSNTLGIHTNCILTSDTSISDIEKIGSGHINLVIREEGLATAKYLQQKFSTPYIYKRPYGIKGTIDWLDEIVDVLRIEKNANYMEDEKIWLDQKYNSIRDELLNEIESSDRKSKISLGGHKDIVKGIMEFGINELNFEKGHVWCDSLYLEDDDIPYYSKNEWMKIFEMKNNGIVMGSGEAIEAFCKNRELQISNPTKTWGIEEKTGPLVGFRGAYELVNIWSKNIDE